VNRESGVELTAVRHYPLFAVGEARIVVTQDFKQSVRVHNDAESGVTGCLRSKWGSVETDAFGQSAGRRFGGAIDIADHEAIEPGLPVANTGIVQGVGTGDT
jgi:hypothetical protein